MFPDCDSWSGTDDEVIRRMEDALVYTFEHMDKSIVLHLAESMQDRVAACIEARGWYTKY